MKYVYALLASLVFYLYAYLAIECLFKGYVFYSIMNALAGVCCSIYFGIKCLKEFR